jgi:hypothetical protein
LSYTRTNQTASNIEADCQTSHRIAVILVEGEGFEPSKAEPSDLQSDPFDRSGIPPNEVRIMVSTPDPVKHFPEQSAYPIKPKGFLSGKPA